MRHAVPAVRGVNDTEAFVACLEWLAQQRRGPAARWPRAPATAGPFRRHGGTYESAFRPVARKRALR